MAGHEQNMAPTCEKLMKNVDLDEPTSFLDHVYLGCTQRECESNETVVKSSQEPTELRLIGYLTESTWKSTMLNPKTNLRTC